MRAERVNTMKELASTYQVSECILRGFLSKQNRLIKCKELLYKKGIY